jgi:hypothetical protein
MVGPIKLNSAGAQQAVARMTHPGSRDTPAGHAAGAAPRDAKRSQMKQSMKAHINYPAAS